MPAKFPKEKTQKTTAKSGSSFAVFKGAFIDARQYFIFLVAARGALPPNAERSAECQQWELVQQNGHFGAYPSRLVWVG